jgi:DNA primase
MAGRIRQDDIDAVKERTDLVKLVSQHLTLKKTGHDSMSGLCPFHQEKTASFSVSPAKQVFYCFGCGKGGDAITFLRELEHLTYVEAVERLAQQAGVTLRYEGDSPSERRAAARRAALIAANERASELFQQMLASGAEAEEARAYLRARGLTAASIETFGIGFAPAYSDFLLRRLSEARDIGPEILLEAGLATRGDDGGMRDRFRSRITFPIHDLQGRGIGFGARILPTDPRAGDQAKYLNTAETPIYRKNEVLYNMHHARPAVSRTGEVFVVEGYTDVIAFAQAGLENTVATCGTALGEGHFRLMSRFAQRAVLAFDSDEAGARAAERAYAFQEQYPVTALVMIMPEGLDPADFVAKEGPDAVREAAKRAQPLVEYMIRRTVARHDLATVEDQAATVNDVLPILESLSNPVSRDEYVHRLADLAGVTESSVMQALQDRRRGKPAEVAAPASKRLSARDKVEREMLKILVLDARWFARFAGRLSEDHFRSPSSRALFAALIATHGDTDALTSGEDAKLAAQVSALAVEPLDGEVTDLYADSVWARLEEMRLKTLSDALRLRLQKLNPTTDDEYDGLFLELVAVDGDLRRLRQDQRDPV